MSIVQLGGEYRLINETIVQIGNKIDKAFLERDESELCNCLCIAQSLRDDCTTPDEAAVLEYFIGNAWADLDRIRSLESKRLWSYRREDHINAIVSYRKSILTKNVSNQIKQGIFLQAYTNLGNMFSESGRVIYAIECWKEALKIEPTFGMAGCNLGHGLVYYAGYQYDGNHKALILRHAYRLLQTYSNQPNIPNESQTVFNKDIVLIEKALCKDYLLASNNFKDFPLGKSNREKLYRKWVLDHGLFLNTLNDLFFDTAIAHDITSLPNMLVRDYSAPVFQGFYNQIKQEYLTARYLLYNYKYEFLENGIHFSDRDRNLVNTFDYPQYGFRYEQLKNSFKMLYSLFDKIGYFLNEYLKLGKEQTKVNFKNVWYRNRQINPNLEELQNNPLRGLYFLSKDLFTDVDRDTEYLEVADPDANKIFDIRNNLEHKYCKIHRFELGETEDNLANDPLAFSITENELAEKTYKLLRYAREALLYLSLAVHVEEKNLHNNDKVIMPLMLFDYDN
jgi:hypothetical protein